MVTFQGYLARHQIPTTTEEIDCSNAQLTDLVGIDQFNRLRSLVLPGNEITTLDLRQNQSMRYCACSMYSYDHISQNKPVRSNPIRELLVSGLRHLAGLYCSNANIQKIDLTGCERLEVLIINNNQLLSLTLKNHPDLRLVWCSHNRLKEIRIENCPNLEIIRCNDNCLSESNIQEIKDQFPKTRQFWKNRQKPRSVAGRPVMQAGRQTQRQIMKRHQERTGKRRYEVSVTKSHLERFEELESRTGLSRADLVKWMLDQMPEK